MKRLHQENLNTVAYYDKMWQQPDVYNFDPTRLQALAKLINKGDNVIELGAGLFGTVQYAYETHLVPATYIALDYSSKAKEIVLERISKISPNGSSFAYVVGDASKKTSFSGKQFNVVIAGEVIEHMEDPAALVCEMARLCKPGGWMTISTVNTKCKNAKKLEYPEHLWEFEPQDLIDLFSPYGVAIYYLFGDYHMIDCQRAA